MTITGYSNAIVSAMLGWLKGFANWVLRLFNLAGSANASPLMWLARNWLKLLIVLLIVGVAADILVWLLRWRPHWVWFRKERVIVNDESFLSESRLDSEPDWDDLEKNWQERDYVVASTVVKRAPETGASRRRPGGREAGQARRTQASGEPSTIVKRRSGAHPEPPADNGGRRAKASFQRSERRAKPGASGRKAKPEKRSRDAEEKRRRLRAERESDLFGLDGTKPDVTDFYEDEVFNVSNLPSTNDYPFEDNP